MKEGKCLKLFQVSSMIPTGQKQTENLPTTAVLAFHYVVSAFLNRKLANFKLKKLVGCTTISYVSRVGHTSSPWLAEKENIFGAPKIPTTYSDSIISEILKNLIDP